MKINYSETRNLNGQIMGGTDNSTIIANVNFTITKQNISNNSNTCNVIGNEEDYKAGMESFNTKAIEMQQEMNNLGVTE